jgi:hypothetical protein
MGIGGGARKAGGCVCKGKRDFETGRRPGFTFHFRFCQTIELISV